MAKGYHDAQFLPQPTTFLAENTGMTREELESPQEAQRKVTTHIYASFLGS